MNFLKDKINKSLFLLGVTIIILVFIISFTSKIKTTTGASLLPFGGMVTDLYYCNCSKNWALTIVGAKPGILSYQAGTVTFSAYQIRPGVWQMGTYVLGGVCTTGVPPACVSARPSIGTMVQVGTSLSL